MATYLDEIVAFHRARAAADRRSRDELADLVDGLGPTRSFRAALTKTELQSSTKRHWPALIAEVKRRSPVKGSLDDTLDPAKLARAYAAGGARCISVLTDSPHFGGSADDLVAARGAVDLPVLRKDFTVAPSDLYDARAMGADAALLIVAVLSDDELAEYVALGETLGLDVLVEVHEERDLERALRAGASLIGVNQRDLHSFEVDTSRAVRVGAAVPVELTKVAESGVSGRDDVERLAEAGFDAVLVGGALVTAGDPEMKARALSAGDVPRDEEARACS